MTAELCRLTYTYDSEVQRIGHNPALTCRLYSHREHPGSGVRLHAVAMALATSKDCGDSLSSQIDVRR